MTRHALSLFQVMLEVYVVYGILNQQWLAPLLCLGLILLIGRHRSAPTMTGSDQDKGLDKTIEIDLEKRSFPRVAVQQH